jgi:hypothetical protein
MPGRGQTITEAHREAIIASNKVNRRKYPVGFDTQSRLYRIWRAMYFRCYQASHKAYPRYGGRGIEVCTEWRESYAAFMQWALDNGYEPHLEIDRRKNDQGYSPDNCRWATRSAQQLNKDNRRQPVSAFGELKIPQDWARDERCRVSYGLLLKRLNGGWPPERALTQLSRSPVRRRNT